MTEADIYQALKEIFSKVFRRDIAVRPDLTAADVPGWDSFRHIDIIMAAEERFGIILETSEIDEMKTLGDLVAIVAARASPDAAG
jgi:acyl carrier protein